jgi:hypothetical protein
MLTWPDASLGIVVVLVAGIVILGFFGGGKK